MWTEIIFNSVTATEKGSSSTKSSYAVHGLSFPCCHHIWKGDSESRGNESPFATAMFSLPDWCRHQDIDSQLWDWPRIKPRQEQVIICRLNQPMGASLLVRRLTDMLNGVIQPLTQQLICRTHLQRLVDILDINVSWLVVVQYSRITIKENFIKS